MSIPKLGIINERQDFKDEFKLKPYCRINKNDKKYLIFGLDKSTCIIDPEIQNLISTNKIKLITEIICKPTFLCYITENFNPLAIEKSEFYSHPFGLMKTSTTKIIKKLARSFL